eukprot:scaffold78895_cov22-Tisochrysis_lutea.AAC.2
MVRPPIDGGHDNGDDGDNMVKKALQPIVSSTYSVPYGIRIGVVIELVRRRLSGQGDIGELLDTLKEPAEAAEYRLRITPTPENPDFKEVGQMVRCLLLDSVQGVLRVHLADCDPCMQHVTSFMPVASRRL